MIEPRKAYDAKYPQRVPMAVAHDGEVYEVEFQFFALKPEAIESYFNAEEEGERSPAEAFFDEHIRGGVGFDDDSREMLIENTPRADKEYCVREALLGVIRKPLPKASKKLNWGRISPNQTYKLTCFFDGDEVETGVILDTPTPEHLRVFRALKSRSFPVRFGDHQITSVAQGLHLLFEAQYHGCVNYQGEVPLHHQLLVMQFHLGGYRELILGK